MRKVWEQFSRPYGRQAMRNNIFANSIASISVKKFQKTILAYYKLHKRSMPWRETRDPYQILVSEVMLQQTQVVRVIPKFKAFVKAFPSVQALAGAPFSKVMKHWSGLGYNRRALALKQCAEDIVSKYVGRVPSDPNALDLLPGIGPATARAISVYTFGRREVFVETNIRTVFLHFYFNKTRRKISDAEIEKLAAVTLPSKNIREWYYALMDYGAMLKSTVGNPNAKSKTYTKQAAFKGSNRELRGRARKIQSLAKELAIGGREMTVIEALLKEGFLERKGGYIQIKN